VDGLHDGACVALQWNSDRRQSDFRDVCGLFDTGRFLTEQTILRLQLTRLLGAESSSEFQARLERYHPGRVVAAEPHAQQSGNNRMIDTILTETMEALTRYHWPGNIRELQNVVERSVIISKGATLTVVL
jgi:hypothetical protein